MCTFLHYTRCLGHTVIIALWLLICVQLCCFWCWCWCFVCMQAVSLQCVYTVFRFIVLCLRDFCQISSCNSEWLYLGIYFNYCNNISFLVAFFKFLIYTVLVLFQQCNQSSINLCCIEIFGLKSGLHVYVQILSFVHCLRIGLLVYSLLHVSDLWLNFNAMQSSIEGSVCLLNILYNKDLLLL